MNQGVHTFDSIFADAAAWQVVASGQAEGKISPAPGADGVPGLRLDYDFHGGGGFVVIRRVLPFRLPETFSLGFDLRGGGPANHFEFKVAGPGGADVWRHQRENHPMPAEWSPQVVTERKLPFAWGPSGGGAPTEVEAVEFVIAAGPGGKGWFELSRSWMADETIRLPADVRASSEAEGYPAAAVFQGGRGAGWRAGTGDSKPVWTVDFGRPARFGGVVVGWPDGLPPRAYVMEISADGSGWQVVHRAHAARGRESPVATQGAEARFLRMTFANPGCAAIASFALRPDAFSRTPNEFIHALAAAAPRGHFPRYWYREQSYWTPVGSPEGGRRALINEEGMVEVDEAGFSLEPFFIMPEGLLTWAGACTKRSLGPDGLPLPVVEWNAPGVRLEVMPWMEGKGKGLVLRVAYRVECQVPGARFGVAIRPFQVNPPWQAFRNLGGRSPIREIRMVRGSWRVDGRIVAMEPAPLAAGAAAFEEGGLMALLEEGHFPSHTRVSDEVGLASAVMVWQAGGADRGHGEADGTGTGQVREFFVSVPYQGKMRKPGTRGRDGALSAWRSTLGKVRWKVPAAAAPAIECFRTAAAHILINRDGPAIQPGPRRYTRSWVRDCVIMGAALAKAGLPHALREFLPWYARFQREDGFVPCVVDRDGVDWLVEHDSHGQFLWGIREVMRHGGDSAFLDALWPHAVKAAEHLLALRRSRLEGEYRGRGEETSPCRGLLPESASHEGYLAHPVHSYWDDFWGIRGLDAAATLAERKGDAAAASRWRGEARDFERDVVVSMERVIARNNIAYLPGSVEWADFDPTATSNAIAMLDFAGVLPAGPMRTMFDTYLEGFRRKHSGAIPWNNYTAYEIRIIGAMVRLGRRGDANHLLDFFLSDRRPREWNQWPEISWRDPLSPGHLGDVPHTWIAAEYLLAVASMIACEREADDSLVLAAGMPWSWVSGSGGFSVRGLPTRFGPLDFKIKASGKYGVDIAISGGLSLPPGGLFVVPPLPPGSEVAETCIKVDALPFRVRHTFPPSRAGGAE